MLALAEPKKEDPLKRPFIALFLISTAACYRMYEGTPDRFQTVSIWLAPHPDLPAEAAREACEAWKPEGVLCTLSDFTHASIRIIVDPRPCEREGDGSDDMAHSRIGGMISINAACLHKRGGTPIDPDVYRGVIAHEIGHQLGIWCHIPAEQGGALMNPSLHRDLHGITELDHAAYALRGRNASLRAADDHGLDCVLSPEE